MSQRTSTWHRNHEHHKGCPSLHVLNTDTCGLSEPYMCAPTASLDMAADIRVKWLFDSDSRTTAQAVVLGHVLVSSVWLESTAYSGLRPLSTESLSTDINLFPARPLLWSLPCFIKAWQFIPKPRCLSMLASPQIIAWVVVCVFVCACAHCHSSSSSF